MVDRTYPPIDYTSRDWPSIRADLLDAASAIVPEWTSRNPNDFGVLLVELMAYAADVLHFYNDRAINEAFLRTAVQRRSVLDLANQLGYSPAPGEAARTTLQFTVQPDVGDVLIPECTRIATSGASGEELVFFELDEDLVIDSNTQTVGTVPATEGVSYKMETVGISSGGALQSFPLPFAPVIGGSIEVFVDEGGGNARWREVENFLDVAGALQVFDVVDLPDGRTAIRFGDNLNGRIPAPQSVVRATYRVGGGTRGNVPAGTLVNPVNSLPGVVSVTNTVPGVGGVDPESLGSIRTNAPRALRSSQRAVSLRDFADLALTRNTVTKANAVQGAGFSPSNRVVDVYVAPASATVLDNTGLQAVEDFLSARAVLGTSVTVYNADYVGINIDATLFVEPNYVALTVARAAEDALNSLLAFAKAEMGGRVPLSAVYRALLSVDGVNYTDVTLLDGSDGRNAGSVADVVLEADEVPVPGIIRMTTNGGL